eukprot:gene6325-8541_t
MTPDLVKIDGSWRFTVSKEWGWTKPLAPDCPALAREIGGERFCPPPLFGDVCMKDSMTLPRRHMLAGSAAALSALGLAGWTGSARAQQAAAAAKPLPAYVSWKDANSTIVHSATTIETKRGAFGTSVITPAEQLYIRNNLPAPDASIVADRDAWEISIEGVGKPRKLTLRELKTLGLETVAMVLQCSGNGRGFFPSKPSGTPWTVGAAGCVVWSGVPVRVVAEALGGIMVAMGAGGSPVRLRDVATVTEGAEPKFGDTLVMGRAGVLMTLSSQYGANTMEVTQGLEAALAELKPVFAKEGITLYPRLHRPASFIETSLANIRHSLWLGAVLGAVDVGATLDLRVGALV